LVAQEQVLEHEVLARARRGQASREQQPEEFKHAFRIADFRPREVLPSDTHELRHTHATHLLGQGADINLVAARLGHATPAFTLSVYGHLLPGADRAAVERLAGRFDHAAEPRPADG
jgi:integrase